jgi:site-specific recombinase XerD
MSAPGLGLLLPAFFVDYLTAQKGLRHSSVQSYRDAVRLLRLFVASGKRCKLSRIELEDLSCDRVQRFVRHLEDGRGNGVSTRNQRFAALHTGGA